MEIRESSLCQAALRVLRTALMGFGICGAIASNACATATGGPSATATGPTIEILALSRGRGVPDATREALQDISTLIDSATEGGAVISMARETIGLEGETRLCIQLRDAAAMSDLAGRIRALARGVELLQVNENHCSVKSEER